MRFHLALVMVMPRKQEDFEELEQIYRMCSCHFSAGNKVHAACIYHRAAVIGSHTRIVPRMDLGWAYKEDADS